MASLSLSLTMLFLASILLFILFFPSGEKNLTFSSLATFYTSFKKTNVTFFLHLVVPKIYLVLIVRHWGDQVNKTNMVPALRELRVHLKKQTTSNKEENNCK